MPETEEARHRIAADIMQRLASYNIDFLPVTGLEGEKPIMVAFEDEQISAVFERIAWSGGYANLIVVGFDERESMVSVLPSLSAVDENAAERMTAAEIHRDASIGMLLTVARVFEDGLRIPVNFGTTSGRVVSGAVPIGA